MHNFLGDQYQRKVYLLFSLGQGDNTLLDPIHCKIIWNYMDKDQKELFLRNRFETRNTPIKRYLRIIRDQSIIYLVINFFIVSYFNDNFSLFADANYITAYIFIFLTFWISSQIFLLPWNIAWARRHTSAWGILVINLLLSWTFIAWIIALIWALSQTEQRIVIRD